MSDTCLVCQQSLPLDVCRWERPDGDVELLCQPCHERMLKTAQQMEAYEHEHRTRIRKERHSD